MNVLVTGAGGFIGRHLMEALSRRPDTEATGIDVDSSPELLDQALAIADAVFHLAGVNRPKDTAEFESGNAGFTRSVCSRLLDFGRSPVVVLSSSTQAALDNPYGQSKRQAEEEVEAYANAAQAPAVVFRLTNVFGKWCRPNYNSAVATFCHNIANDIPVTVSDPSYEMNLVYIDDVVAAFLRVLDGPPELGTCDRSEPGPWHTVTLGNLVHTLQEFRASRESLILTDYADPFKRKLYGTYLSYLPLDAFAYTLNKRSDARGSLAEFVKSSGSGQIFVSRTHPGITRGNHYHHTKTEKFLVVEGSGIVRFRRIDGAEVLEYAVSGDEYCVVDIPPGYTHSIENVGKGEMVTIFWASEVFDPEHADTFYLEVRI